MENCFQAEIQVRYIRRPAVKVFSEMKQNFSVSFHLNKQLTLHKTQ